jgi:hypothetical protein
MPGLCKRNCCGRTVASAVAVSAFMTAMLASSQTAVTTYHYDNNRAGWNPNEPVLTPANVNGKSFGVLRTMALDDQRASMGRCF